MVLHRQAEVLIPEGAFGETASDAPKPSHSSPGSKSRCSQVTMLKVTMLKVDMPSFPGVHVPMWRIVCTGVQGTLDPSRAASSINSAGQPTGVGMDADCLPSMSSSMLGLAFFTLQKGARAVSVFCRAL